MTVLALTWPEAILGVAVLWALVALAGVYAFIRLMQREEDR
jgi:hypothetical protein